MAILPLLKFRLFWPPLYITRLWGRPRLKPKVRFQVPSFKFQVSGIKFQVSSFRIKGSRFRVQVVWGSGLFCPGFRSGSASWPNLWVRALFEPPCGDQNSPVRTCSPSVRRTHHSATTTPQWCPLPAVLHRTQGGRPPQPPNGGHQLATPPPCLTTDARRSTLHGEARSSQKKTRLGARCTMMAKAVKETATSAQTRGREQRETQSAEQQHPKQLRFDPGLWTQRDCGQAQPPLLLCTQKGPFTVCENPLENAFTVLPFHTCCGFMLPTSAERGWLHIFGIPRIGPHPSCQISPRRNFETFQTSELICRPCCCIEMGRRAVAG